MQLTHSDAMEDHAHETTDGLENQLITQGMAFHTVLSMLL